MSSSWAQFITGIAASTVTLAALVLALMALAHLSLRWWIQRKARQDDATVHDSTPVDLRHRRWVIRGLREILPPLALLIWIHGLYFTLSLLLRQTGPQTLVDPALVALTWAYSLSVVGAIFWLLSRTGRLIEAFLVSLSARAETSWDDLLLPLAGKAVRRGLPLLAIILGAPALAISPALAEVVRNATSLLLIGVVAFILFQIVDGQSGEAVLEMHNQLFAGKHVESRRRVQIAARSLPVRRRAADDLIVEKQKILDGRNDRIESGLPLPRGEPNFEDTFLACKRYRLPELRPNCGISPGSLCPGSCAGKCSHH